MNKTQLDSFLFNLSLYEECLKNNKLDKEIIAYIQNNPKGSDKKFPWLFKNINIKSNDRIPQLPALKNIDISCHPRFSKKFYHHHSFIEIIYVYSGQCHQHINNEEIIMNEGDICILDTNTVHAIDETCENDIIINCLMSQEYIDNVLIERLSQHDLITRFFIHSIYQRNEFKEYMLFRTGKSEKIKELMSSLLCEFFAQSICSSEVINCYIVLILTEILRFEKTVSNNTYFSETKNNYITDIINFIQEHCKEISLTTVANHFHYHPNYLSQIIKNTTGHSFTNILQKVRLKKAYILLKNSNIPVNKIAQEVGFKNISFFYKLFKEKYGLTPAEVRLMEVS